MKTTLSLLLAAGIALGQVSVAFAGGLAPVTVEPDVSGGSVEEIALLGGSSGGAGAAAAVIGSLLVIGALLADDSTSSSPDSPDLD
jgi:hypothetical protein